MNDTFFNVPENGRERLATVYTNAAKDLETPANPLVIGTPACFSGTGGDLFVALKKTSLGTDRKEQVVLIMFVQTPWREQQYGFDNAASQAVIAE